MNAWAPDTLDADALLANHGPKVAERVMYLGHTVFGRMLRDARFREAGACPLQAKHLRAVLGTTYLDQRRGVDIREVAEAAGYIGRSRSYQAGAYSQSYCIMPPHDAARLLRHPLTDRGLCRAIQRTRERLRAETWQRIREGRTLVAPDICENLWGHLQRVELADFEPATPYEQIASDRLRHGRLWLTVDDYGRVHTPLTSLPRAMRPFLRVKGQPIAGVDIGESQPLFCGLAVAKGETPEGGTRNPTTTGTSSLMMRISDAPTMMRISADLRAYLEACESRALYQTVADRLGMPREAAKRRVMAVFFGKPHHRTRASRALEAAFPATWEAIQALKRKHGYASLAHAAQRAESGFIFGRCVQRLMAEGLWIATIHDSILTTAGSEGIVRDVMAEEFERLGLRPTLTVERFCD